MRLLTATVVDGRLDLPEGTLEDGSVVTLLVPENEAGFELDEQQRAFLRESIAQADRGEGVDGWQLLAELRAS